MRNTQNELVSYLNLIIISKDLIYTCIYILIIFLVSTKLDNVLVKWTRGRPYKQPFLVKTKINYDSVEILYKPKFWQVMKWAWIQYFSILVLSVFIFKKVKLFLFANHIVTTKIERST